MKELLLDEDFDVDEITSKINKIMSKWSIQFLDIRGPNWTMYDYDMNVRFYIQFQVDFNDIETRIKLEDLKLNVIYHINSLKDETCYRDNLVDLIYF